MAVKPAWRLNAHRSFPMTDGIRNVPSHIPAEKQMALTSPAVGCAETGNRCLHIRPPPEQMGEGALIATGEDQGGAACGALGQPVDMPVAGFPRSEVASDAGAKAARPVGAAAIEIIARTQARFR